MENSSGTETPAEGDEAISGESESLYEAMFRKMGDAAFLIDVGQADGEYTFTYRRSNRSYQQQTGLSEGEIRGENPRELLGDEQGAFAEKKYRQCVEQREEIEYEETMDLSGETNHWQITLTLLTDNGQVAQILGVARDTTKQKEQDRTTQRIRRGFETVMETMSAAVFLKNADSEYLMMNRACRELFNVGDRDVRGLSDEEIVPSDVAEKAKADDQRVIEDGEMVEIEETVPTATGATVRLTRKSPVYDDGEIVALCGVSTDITEQKQREQELRRLKEHFELAVDGANLGVWDWNMLTDKVEFNDYWAEMLGYTNDDLSSYIDTLERLIHPEDLQSASDALQAHIDGETGHYDHEIRMQTKGGDWKWVRTTGKVVNRNDQGTATRAAGVHIDIDDRKEAEQKLRRQNSRLDEFASVVSHDLRNPLNVAQARTAILQEHSDDELQEHLSSLATAVERMESIIEDTLTLARQGETVGEMGSISIIDLIGKCWAGVETADATLEIDDDFTIRGDRDRLQHVFENLFRNAVEHGGEDLTVRVGRAGESSLYVEDDGVGIPPDDRDTVLEPGHTSATGGTGLGLTIAKRIAEAHGWEVRITDGRDGGARFEFDTVRLID